MRMIAGAKIFKAFGEPEIHTSREVFYLLFFHSKTALTKTGRQRPPLSLKQQRYESNSMNIVAKHVISAQNALVLQPYQFSKNTSTAIHGIHKAISQKLVTATNS